MSGEILPGATLGVLGSGQLGRMFAIEARRLGYGVQVFSPEANTPAGQVADREWVADYDDLDALTQFAHQVEVVTLEFENVSPVALRHLDKLVPVRPGARVLEVAQNRRLEKETLRSIGLPTAPFALVEDESQLRARLSEFGGKGILKTVTWGYDGKGQTAVSEADDLAEVWTRIQEPRLLEGFVEFESEISVIAVRSPAGEVRCYDPILNQHRNHILDVSVIPGPGITIEVAQAAKELATELANALDVVGVLCVEMFLEPGGILRVNEIAPRPHNSGHLTIDAHFVSQFEQQVRAVCGLPLGATHLRQPAAMANLLGDLWPAERPPAWSELLRRPGLKLHLYGKSKARPGRKMGHLTALAENADDALQMARSARESLSEFPAGETRTTPH